MAEHDEVPPRVTDGADDPALKDLTLPDEGPHDVDAVKGGGINRVVVTDGSITPKG